MRGKGKFLEMPFSKIRLKIYRLNTCNKIIKQAKKSITF